MEMWAKDIGRGLIFGGMILAYDFKVVNNVVVEKRYALEHMESVPAGTLQLLEMVCQENSYTVTYDDTVLHYDGTGFVTYWAESYTACSDIDSHGFLSICGVYDHSVDIADLSSYHATRIIHMETGERFTSHAWGRVMEAISRDSGLLLQPATLGDIARSSGAEIVERQKQYVASMNTFASYEFDCEDLE
jgi:hypothetical protein